MSNISEFEKIQDINFIDNLTPQKVRENLIQYYKDAVKELTGEDVELASGAPERLMLYAISAQDYQTLKYIDTAAKMSFLKYSCGDYLDNLGLLRGLTRKEATPATCTVEFTLSMVRDSATGIAAGTRLKSQNLYFLTSEYLEIPAGATAGTVAAMCETAGTEGNSVAENEIKTLVDPLPYIASVTNITPCTGGADIENDDKFTRRIYECPAGYSVAGPTDAYVFHTKNAIADIGDVIAYTPEPGAITVAFIMADGSLPNIEKIEQVQKALNADEIRPLTDTVTAKAPDEVTYNIDLTYYIGQSDAAGADSIQQAVNDAITAYTQWQRHIGRDVTASKLIQFIMAAGAKRVEVVEPVYIATAQDALPKLEIKNVIYGGLEND